MHITAWSITGVACQPWACDISNRCATAVTDVACRPWALVRFVTGYEPLKHWYIFFCIIFSHLDCSYGCSALFVFPSFRHIWLFIWVLRTICNNSMKKYIDEDNMTPKYGLSFSTWKKNTVLQLLPVLWAAGVVATVCEPLLVCVDIDIICT